MAALVCPSCGTQVPAQERWAATTVSLLIQAPAVNDLATQTRCPGCGRVVAERDERPLSASRHGGLVAFAILVGLGLAAIALWQLV